MIILKFSTTKASDSNIQSLLQRYADPFTWLEMIRNSKSKYDVKKRGGSSQSERSNECQADEMNGESSQRPL